MTDRSNEAQIDRPDITSAPINTTIDDVDASKHLAGHSNYHGIDTSQVQPGADAVYEAKISMLNEALIDIGMGPFQWKIFMTTGFGWFIDQVYLSHIYAHLELTPLALDASCDQYTAPRTARIRC